MMNLTAPMKVRSRLEVLSRGPHEPLILASFCRSVEVPVIDDNYCDTGKTTTETTIGFITASRTQLEWIRELLLSLEYLSRTFTLSVSADGTYRLCSGTTKSGAVLVDLGLHDVTYNKSKDCDKHNFLPIMYMYCQTECFEAYSVLFETLKSLPTKFLDLPNRQIRPKFGHLDRASYIAKAYLSVWPREEVPAQ